MIDSKLADETGRILALHRYDVLDTEEEAAFENITSLVQSIFNVPMVTVSLVDTNRQWFKARRGVDACGTARDISFCTHAINGRSPLAVVDALEDERFSNSPLVRGEPYIRSYLGVPLETPDGYNIGSLCVMDRVPRAFSSDQVAVLMSFAQLIMGELELRQIARVDALTQALTRRSFVAEAEKEVTRCRRYRAPATLVMLDIDHFKSINDRLGHPAGDQVLIAVANLCIESLRSNDAFGRLGGEEFAFLLPHTDIAGALICAERCRAAMEELVHGGAVPVPVTASFGLAAWWEDCASTDMWIAAADRALFAAKRAGRNRCLISSDLPALNG
jgi:diguanylate cyclase (GGDEF)-like protein